MQRPFQTPIHSRFGSPDALSRRVRRQPERLTYGFCGANVAGVPPDGEATRPYTLNVTGSSTPLMVSVNSSVTVPGSVGAIIVSGSTWIALASLGRRTSNTPAVFSLSILSTRNGFLPRATMLSVLRSPGASVQNETSSGV